MDNNPLVKFESPIQNLADSFPSTPMEGYSPLFSDMASHSTPQSIDEDSVFGDGSMIGSPAVDAKPAKKRKSWGQQLPEPKTHLPPRKRAKTEDEKEQRRVERVLRNRRAAQSSRERKRQEVEALEQQKRLAEGDVEQLRLQKQHADLRNRDLEIRLAEMQSRNEQLQQQLQQFTGGKMVVFQGSSVASSPAPEQVRSSTPVTFSKELFAGQQVPMSRSFSNTVNPASLSPEMRPVSELSNARSSDMTQHPAAVLCDLQCQSEEQRPWTTTTLAIPQIMAIILLINMTSTTYSAVLNPLSQILTSLTTKSSLSPTASLLTLIIWVVTTTTPLMNSSSTSSLKNSSPLRSSLRISLLRRLLACSPNLARPLMDATMEQMRSASKQQLSHDCQSRLETGNSTNSPSVELLMTLLWTIHVISKEEQPLEEDLKPDGTEEMRQSCLELYGLVRPDIFPSVSGGGLAGQKSLDTRRTASP